MSATRKIIHVDMDAFYVSVEIRDNPELANKPVAVGGSSERRGVLSTCNYIARKYGVSSAMPTGLALKKCPDLIVVPGRMEVYKETSQIIRQVYERYTDLIEPLSLDEAYLDVTDCELFHGSATLIAEQIRKDIFEATGLTASAGIAPIKYLAKIASDLNKPNGQYTITPEDVWEFIKTMPLKKIPGVGKVTQAKLEKLNLKTGQDVRQADESLLVRHLGKYGRVLWQRCHGIDNRSVEVSRIRKSVGVERTFSSDIRDMTTLLNILNEQLIPELHKRSKKHLESRCISKVGVKLKFSDFQLTTKELKFDALQPDVFIPLLEEAFERGHGKAIRLLGVHIGLAEPQTDKPQLALTF